MLLWLVPKNYTHPLRQIYLSELKARKFNPAAVVFNDTTTYSLSKHGPKKSIVANLDFVDDFFARLDALILRVRPKAIAISDPIVLEFFTHGEFRSCFTTRGSVYSYQGLPVMVMLPLRSNNAAKNYPPTFSMEPYNSVILRRDIEKLLRFYAGKPQWQPAFNFQVVNNEQTMQEIEQLAETASLIAVDIETSGHGPSAIITCIGYTFLHGRTCKTFVLPFVNPSGPEGSHWANDEQLARAYACMKTVNASASPKVLQNGSYDAAYLLRYCAPMTNWIADTHVLWHSMFVEMPKNIAFISSLTCDRYRYWKDESATEEVAKEDQKLTRVPQTPDGFFRYLRYCGLDTYYTLCASLPLLKACSQAPWVKTNNARTMRQVLGPAFAMSMRGARINPEIYANILREKEIQGECALAKLRFMLDEPGFNPNSWQQIQKLIYDLLGATDVNKRKPKATDEKTLGLIQSQHPFYSVIIEAIWNAKKPFKFLADYNPDKLAPWNNRWYYSLKAAGTETERYASSESNFWIGMQFQNPPYDARNFVEPDPGYVLFNIDYSKADFWHTAFASGEPTMIKVALDKTIDLHCYHASVFFKKSYEEIYAGYKQKLPWVVDSIKGVRQNSKRIVYGANYLMAGMTLYMTMGHEAVEATAHALGENTSGWILRNYVNFCQSLLNVYFDVMYPELRAWLNAETRQVAQNSNLATCCGGRTRWFFGDLMKDNATQREFAAFYGQGGTACMTNDALSDIYWGGTDSQDVMLLSMMHDSIFGQVKETKLELVETVGKLMERKLEFRGRKFSVPVEIEVGYGWGYRMTEYTPGMSLDDIRQGDEKWQKKKYSQILATIQKFPTWKSSMF